MVIAQPWFAWFAPTPVDDADPDACADPGQDAGTVDAADAAACADTGKAAVPGEDTDAGDDADAAGQTSRMSGTKGFAAPINARGTSPCADAEAGAPVDTGADADAHDDNAGTWAIDDAEANGDGAAAAGGNCNANGPGVFVTTRTGAVSESIHTAGGAV